MIALMASALHKKHRQLEKATATVNLDGVNGHTLAPHELDGKSVLAELQQGGARHEAPVGSR